jgi:dihydroorotase-like cyclic amidohydrolase
LNSIFVIRVETVVTASGAGRSDDEVEDGSIVAVAETLPKATQEIDAFRLLVMGLCHGNRSGSRFGG